jgi:hypothetical protein
VVPSSEPPRNPPLLEPSSARVVASVAVVIDALVVGALVVVVLVVVVPTSAPSLVDPLDAPSLPALPASATDGPHARSMHNGENRITVRR